MSADFSSLDQEMMERALELAAAAAEQGEVPVGAVITCENEIVAEAYNLREAQRDPLAHAELLAIRAAAQKLERWRLFDCELFVTLEPCAMCAGAIVNARIGRLVFGATDPKAGAVRSLYSIADDERLNHRTDVAAGLLEERCGAILSDFFRARRKK